MPPMPPVEIRAALHTGQGRPERHRRGVKVDVAPAKGDYLAPAGTGHRGEAEVADHVVSGGGEDRLQRLVGRRLAPGLTGLRWLDAVGRVGHDQVPANRSGQRGVEDCVHPPHRRLSHAGGPPARVEVVDVDRAQAVECDVAQLRDGVVAVAGQRGVWLPGRALLPTRSGGGLPSAPSAGPSLPPTIAACGGPRLSQELRQLSLSLAASPRVRRLDGAEDRLALARERVLGVDDELPRRARSCDQRQSSWSPIVAFGPKTAPRWNWPLNVAVRPGHQTLRHHLRGIRQALEPPGTSARGLHRQEPRAGRRLPRLRASASRSRLLTTLRGRGGT